MSKMFPRCASGLAVLLLPVFFGGLARAEVCCVCGNSPLEFFVATDKITGETKHFCTECGKLTTRCYLCGLPAKDNITELVDGRVLCSRDAKEAVLDEEEAKRICRDAREEMGRLFSRFIRFPDSNATIEIVDRTRMEQLLQTPGFERQCPSIFGYVRSRVAQGGQWKHPISILSALPKYRLTAVCAHEFAHTWVRENVPTDRDMDRDAEEGFCEFIAYRLVELLTQDTEMRVIKGNYYTRGQFALFLDADATYGFYTIMQWMKWGVDHRLSDEEPDRIRRIEEKRLPRPAVGAEAEPLILGPSRVPERLTLIGILSAGSRKLALINDRSLAVGESGKVRVGTTNAVVRCVEIRTNSVIVEVGEPKCREELVLKSD